MLPMYLIKKVGNPFAGTVIQIARGFVGQQQTRSARQSACYDDALLFAAGQLPGAVVEAFSQSHFPQSLCSHGGRLALVIPAD